MRGVKAPQGVRLAKLTRKGAPDECWPFLGSLKKNGYGQFKPDNAKNGYAHRVAYEEAHGPIPDDMTVDHMCHTKECREGDACEHRRCVNPAHLELRDRVGNWRRTQKDECPSGHPYREGSYRWEITAGGYRSRRCLLCQAVQRQRTGARRNIASRKGTRERISADVKAEIRRRHAAGETQRALSVEFGITNQHVSRICNGRRDRVGNPVPSPATRLLVRERDGHACFRCRTMSGRLTVHHRLPRQLGGSSDPALQLPSNLILLCGDGTRGCHGWVESNRFEAYRLGYLVHRGQDPARAPIYTHDGRMVWLTSDGQYEVLPEGETA